VPWYTVKTLLLIIIAIFWLATIDKRRERERGKRK